MSASITRTFLAVAALATTAATTGCAISGLDAKANFACKAPEGVQCESMSGVYANAMQNNLPGQRPKDAAPDSAAPVQPSYTPVPGPAPSASPPKTKALSLAQPTAQPITTGMPLRSNPTVLRIWFAPWEDGDGDLHDQAYVYLPIDGGRWLIEHNRRRIQETYRAVRAPADVATAAASAGKVPPQPAPPRQADALPKAAQDALNGLIRQGVGMPQTEVSSD